MTKEIKEVFDIIEKVFQCPACFAVAEKPELLDKIMTTYAKRRNQILQEMKAFENHE